MHERHGGLPPLDQLRGFEAAARHLSFTRAGAELHLTQSAISRQVQALEQALGVALFVRHHRALALTPAGAALLKAVSESFRQLRQTLAQIGAAEDGRPVTISTSVGFASLWLVPRLPGFQARHPGIDVRISADNRVVDLERGDVDLAVRYCAPQQAPADALRLFAEAVLPVASPALLRSLRRKRLTPGDLPRIVLLEFEQENGRHPWLSWQEWLSNNGCRLSPRTMLRFTQYDQVIQAAVSGQGVALGRAPLVAPLIARRQLVAAFGGDIRKPAMGYFLIRNQGARRAATERLAEWIVAEAAA